MDYGFGGKYKCPNCKKEFIDTPESHFTYSLYVDFDASGVDEQFYKCPNCNKPFRAVLVRHIGLEKVKNLKELSEDMIETFAEEGE